MTIKDFKVGDIAYLMDFHNRNINIEETEIRKVEVSSVGRKYLKVKFPNTHLEYGSFEEDTQTNLDLYLADKNHHSDNKLFKTLSNIDTYKKYKKLQQDIQELTNWYNIEKYSVDQLRRIKAIFDESVNETLKRLQKQNEEQVNKFKSLLLSKGFALNTYPEGNLWELVIEDNEDKKREIFKLFNAKIEDYIDLYFSDVETVILQCTEDFHKCVFCYDCNVWDISVVEFMEYVSKMS